MVQLEEGHVVAVGLRQHVAELGVEGDVLHFEGLRVEGLLVLQEENDKVSTRRGEEEKVITKGGEEATRHICFKSFVLLVVVKKTSCF